MKMKKLYLLTLIFLLFFCNSCKFDCPAFSDENLKWIPYENKQEIKFTNLQDTIIFKTDDFLKTEEYQTSPRYSTGCHSWASCNTKTSKDLNIGINIFGEEFENDIDYSYTFNHSNCSDVYFFKKKDNNISNYDKFHDTITINKTKYENVIYFTKENSSSICRIKELYIAENYGIIKFVETDSTEWVLIN